LSIGVKLLKGNALGGPIVDLAGPVQMVDKVNKSAPGVRMVNKLGRFIGRAPAVAMAAAW
jgi:hypothetical protein